MATPADALRRRLEDRAELLETALVRARALRLLLSGFFWRGKLARNAGLLHQMAEADPEVDAVLRATLRRAEAEGWLAGDPLTRCVEELASLREQLTALAARRLRMPPDELPLADLLLRLDASLAGPRKILPGQKWNTALEVLPRTLPELERAGAAGERLALLFGRPTPPTGAVALSLAEVDELKTLLPEAEEALGALWRRVHGCDPSGALLRFLQRRSRRAPTRVPRNGPEVLLRAAFWNDVAWNRLRSGVAERFSPAEVAEGELLEALRWLVGLEADPDLRLPASEALAEPRAALLELSHRLASPRAPGQPRGRAPLAPWERLAQLARLAEQAGASPDVERVKETLRLFVQIREREQQLPRRPERPRPGPGSNQGPALGPHQQPGDGLEALVERARALAPPPR